MKLDIGGEGPSVLSSVEISGCECRHDDFVMALVRFARKWRSDADLRELMSTPEPKAPCGCGEVSGDSPALFF